tara:strand:- start:168 stop:1367 length:1200 start_codon:yes stop_codon:yes gene_type:complete
VLLSKKVDIVFIYQRMLPYHVARFKAVFSAFQAQGKTCMALEVASTDSSYGDLTHKGMDEVGLASVKRCLFEKTDYLTLSPSQVALSVEQALKRLNPSVVFSPAPAFAEGAGALHYRVKNTVKWILMDDAWGVTDQRSWLTSFVKRQFYRYVDGGFFPSAMHGDYFAGLNVPKERQRYGVDAVDDYRSIRENQVASEITGPYFLFVGRLIEHKGLGVALRAYSSLESDKVKFVIVGDGPNRRLCEALVEKLQISDHVIWVGRRSNEIARLLMRDALGLILPSKSETWGLVVNEAWQVGLPVLGSDTVGALCATRSPETEWMLVPVGDVDKWQAAMERLLALSDQQREAIAERGRMLAEQHSIRVHAQSALELAALPHRRNPFFPIGIAALLWKGKTAIW